MSYKNVKGNDKIVGHYKSIKNPISLYVPILWLGYLPYYLHTNRTCQKINMFI